MRAVGGVDCVVKVDGKCYRQKEAQKLATNYDIAMRLGMYDFAIDLFNTRRKDRDPTDFIISLITLRNAAEELGIEPTPEEIKQAIPTLPVFQQPFVTKEYLENNLLGPNGFTDSDLAQLVKDYLSYQKLRELVGSGVQTVPSEVDKFYVQQNQRFDASAIHFNREDFVGKVNLTEEDVKKYYEDNKESLLSEEKRAFNFVKFIPKKLADDATQEAKANAKLDFANAMNRIYADLAEEGTDFVAGANRAKEDNKDFGIEVGQFAAFAPDAAPEAIGKDPAQLGSLFSKALIPGAVTVPFSQEDGSYYVYNLKEVVAPKPLELKDARKQIETVLKNQKSNQLVNDAALAARGKLVEALEGGKKIAAAAKEAGVELVSIPNFSESEPPAGVDDSSLIIGAVSGLEANQVSDVVTKPGGKGYLLAHVERLQLYKNDDIETEKRAISASRNNEVKRTLFTSWLNQKRREADGQRAGSAAGPVESAPVNPEGE